MIATVQTQVKPQAPLSMLAGDILKREAEKAPKKQPPKERAAAKKQEINIDVVIAYYDIIERQKEKICSMIMAIKDAAPRDDIHLQNLASIASDVANEHSSWYELQKALGIKEAIAEIREREVSA